jgi:hypothetical protein
VFTILAAAYLVTSLRAPALTLRYGRTVIGVGAVTVAVETGLLLAAVAVAGTSGSRGWLVPGLRVSAQGRDCLSPGWCSPAPGRGYGHASTVSLRELACLPLAVTALTWLPPRPKPPVPG